MTRIYAHRALAYGPDKVDENTLISAVNCYSCKVGAIEVDVRMDGDKVICSHEYHSHYKYPTDFYDIAVFCKRHRLSLYIDVKEMIAGHIAERICWELCFFDVVVASRIRKYYPIYYPNGAIVDNLKQLNKFGNYQFISINANYFKGIFGRIKFNKLKRQGRRIFIWVVNNVHDMAKFKRWGADVIMTDYAGKYVL